MIIMKKNKIVYQENNEMNYGELKTLASSKVSIDKEKEKSKNREDENPLEQERKREQNYNHTHRTSSKYDSILRKSTGEMLKYH